jgi:15-O-acetyltransferase Tri3
MAPRLVFHPWTKSNAPSGVDVVSRPLATGEFVLAMLNEHAQGQNCPYLGAKISIEHKDDARTTANELVSNLRHAFALTRWSHPTVAAQVRNSKELVYPVENAQQVSTWLERTVQVVKSPMGWMAQHEQLSRGAVLPTHAGDCALLYLIIHPDQVASGNIVHFELLLHVHHALVDGAGLRTLLDSILHNLVAPSTGTLNWGEETQRLAPSVLDAAFISEGVVEQLSKMPEV